MGMKKRIGNLMVHIYRDDAAENPRIAWDSPIVHMVCFHKRYILSEPHEFESPEEFLATVEDGWVALAIYLYDHSGLTVSTTPFSCRWDSGQVGWVYMTAEEVHECGGEEKALKHLKCAVNTLDMYLRGDVYVVEFIKINKCETCGHEELEVVDSCSEIYTAYPTKEIPEIIDIPEEFEKFFVDDRSGWVCQNS